MIDNLCGSGFSRGILAAAGWLAFASMSLGADGGQPQLLRLFSAVFSGDGEEKVALPPQWADNMVLQRDVPIPIAGKAEPGQEVTVIFDGQTKVATADANGNWQVALDPLPPSAEPKDLRVIPGCIKCSKEIRNVLVGDVWLCGGAGSFPTPAAGFGDDSTIRICAVRAASDGSLELPQTWQEGKGAAASGQSALHRAFARALQAELSVPIGLVDCGSLPTAHRAGFEGIFPPVISTLEIPFPIRGVLWSVDSAAPRQKTAASELATQIQSWRKRSGQADAGVLFFVEDPDPQASAGSSAVWQELQRDISASPRSRFLVLEGKNPEEAGKRLAAEALRMGAGSLSIPPR